MHPEPRRGIANAIVSQSCRECTIDGYASPNPVTPYSLGLSVPRASSTVDLSLGIRHKVDLQPLMERRRNALEHGERMAVVIGVF